MGVVIPFAEAAHRVRSRADRDLAAHQVDLLLAPYRFGVAVALAVTIAALLPFIGSRR